MHRGLITKSPPILIGGYESQVSQPPPSGGGSCAAPGLTSPTTIPLHLCVLRALWASKSVAAAVRRRTENSDPVVGWQLWPHHVASHAKSADSHRRLRSGAFGSRRGHAAAPSRRAPPPTHVGGCIHAPVPQLSKIIPGSGWAFCAFCTLGSSFKKLLLRVLRILWAPEKP